MIASVAQGRLWIGVKRGPRWQFHRHRHPKLLRNGHARLWVLVATWRMLAMVVAWQKA